MWWVRDRDPIDTPCRVRVGYLFSGLWKGREKRKGEKVEEQREVEGGGENRAEWREAEAAFSEGRKEVTKTGSGRKICLPQQTGEGVGRACLLKDRTDQVADPSLSALASSGPDIDQH